MGGPGPRGGPFHAGGWHSATVFAAFVGRSLAISYIHSRQTYGSAPFATGGTEGAQGEVGLVAITIYLSSPRLAFLSSGSFSPSALAEQSRKNGRAEDDTLPSVRTYEVVIG